MKIIKLVSALFIMLSVFTILPVYVYAAAHASQSTASSASACNCECGAVQSASPACICNACAT